MLKRRQQGQVAILTIDRSNRRNALGTELMQDFSRAFAELDHDDGIASIVVSATAPGFCAGSDLKELATMNIAQMCHHEAETARIVRAIGFLEKPVVAAVSGFALGGGVGLGGRLRPDRDASGMPLAHAGGAERLVAAVGAGFARRKGRPGDGPAAGLGKRADYGRASL